MNQNGYHPQGMQGYGAGQNRYSAPQYTTPQVPFNQNADPGYAQQGTPYANPNPGAYAQQAAQGYAMPGYQAVQNAPAPQNPYIQGVYQGYSQGQSQQGYSYP
ncbi:MAG: hypothetical protein IKV43_02525, partial [Clostridia bacterium]|nr:hypothetical protein [Clostridia bacterium]